MSPATQDYRQTISADAKMGGTLGWQSLAFHASGLSLPFAVDAAAHVVSELFQQVPLSTTPIAYGIVSAAAFVSTAIASTVLWSRNEAIISNLGSREGNAAPSAIRHMSKANASNFFCMAGVAVCLLFGKALLTEKEIPLANFAAMVPALPAVIAGGYYGEKHSKLRDKRLGIFRVSL